MSINYEVELKKIREKLGLPQHKMAKMFGVTLGGYRLWEMGVGKPSYDNRLKIKEVLKELASQKQEG
jgi:DNA-binding transcriptional regulator YiaG